MPVEVKVPAVGESITEGVLGVWSKKEGEYVQEGDVLFEIETDKVTSDVYATASGALHQLVTAGATVQVGQAVAEIDTAAAKPEAAAEAPAAPTAASGAAATPGKKTTSAKSVPENASNSSPATVPGRGGDDVPLSPAVRGLVEEKNIDPSQVKGSGKDGRLTKGDVLAAIENSGAKSTSAPAPAASPAPAAAPVATGERTTRKKMTPLRARIAARLLSAQQEAAILTTFNEVDMSNVTGLRTRFQDRFVKTHGVKLGFMSLFVQATIYALKKVPGINARLDGDVIVQNHFYDIGVAISTEKGLMVPVLRNADQMSLAQIENAIAAYAKKARDGKITLPDLEGGVFTITNGGVFGSLLSTPIINPPQSGILGMHTIQERPVAINGRVEIRPMMYLAVSYDHRIVDGKEAVTFLVSVKEFIEQPAVAMLSL